MLTLLRGTHPTAQLASRSATMPTPLPFTPPYALVFWLIYAWVFGPEFRIVRRASRSLPDAPEDRGSLRVVLVCASVAILTTFLLPFLVPRATLPGDRVVWFVIGLVTLIAGSLLRRHCFRVLGAFFTGAVKIQPGHCVVDQGAYRWVRHPSYSAALIMYLGIALALDNWLGAVISFVIALPAYWYRARVEERALLSALGPAYAEFMTKRKRFVPFIV